RELGIQSAAEDVVTAKSQLFPQVDAFYGIQNVKPSVGAETSERIYGIGLRWNIFAGFSDYNQISQARALKMAKEAELEFEKRKLELEFKESKEKLSLMQEKLPILEGSLEAARERAKTVNEQYKAGLRSYLDWEQSQSKLIRSEEDLLEGKNSLLLAIADYEKQQGLGL
ncbi:MAG: TolC family protein, partial [Pseudobdellovibrionaceae bacterium]